MLLLRKYWESIRSSYWFLPSLMVLASGALALLAIDLDASGGAKLVSEIPWMYTRGPEGARAILATVAGSMITVAGVVFSITIVALSLATNQFGPRLLRNFTSDRGNHVVLGAFLSTFVYCLLVLRTIRGQDENEFVPHIAVAIAILLSLGSLGLLIYFIHHVSTQIQAPNVIAQIGREVHESIDRLFPEQIGGAAKDEPECAGADEVPPLFDREAGPLRSADSGYLQAVDQHALMKIASREGLIVKLSHRPGDFVVKGGPLARVWPGSRVDESLTHRLLGALVIGSKPTPTQDPGFAVNQIVEIAVRALSPGTNDPFTAISCLDQIGAALCHLGERNIPSSYRCDDAGRLRIVAPSITFSEFADMTLDPIRHYARSSPGVLNRLMDVLQRVIPRVGREEDRQALLRHALLVRGVGEDLPPKEKGEIEARYQAVLRAMASEEGAGDPQEAGSLGLVGSEIP